MEDVIKLPNKQDKLRKIFVWAKKLALTWERANKKVKLK